MLKNLFENIWPVDVDRHSEQVHSGSVFQHENRGVTCTIEELIALKLQAQQVHFPYKRKSKVQLSGGKLSALRGRGIDFDEVRAYQAGDEIRSIDWKVTARTGVAHTKVYREEKEKPVYLLLDLRSSMFFGSNRYFKSVIACHCAALLAWSTIKNGDRLGALVFSDHKHQELKPKSGSKGVLNFIRSAAQYSQDLLDTSTNQSQGQSINPLGNKSNNKSNNDSITQANKQSLPGALQKLHQVVRPGSLIYLLSDFHDFDEKAQQHLSLLSRHNDLIALRIFDPLEQNLPQANSLSGSFAFTHSHQNQIHAKKLKTITELVANDKKIRRAYSEHFLQKYLSLEQALLTTGIPIKNISSALEALSQLEYPDPGKVTGGNRK